MVEGSERVLANLFDEEHREARELNAYEIRETELRNDVARTQALYDGIVKRVQEASLLKEYGGFEARIIAPPRLGKKVFPSAATTGAVSMCLGLLGGLGLAWLVDAGASKRRLQVERRGSAWKVIGQLPPFVPLVGEASAMSSSSNLDPLLFVHHQPRSPAANACRAVRNALLAEAADTGHKVLQITSPRDGDGVSVVAANLAIALAQAGRKTLLLDADLLQPQQHRNFGLPEGPGLTSILSESAEIADAVLDSGIRNLWVLPFGPLVRDARQLLAARRFHELFSVFRDQYDCILVDTPSLQTATEASLVTPWVDAVLLIVRADEQATQDAEQASQVLAALGVEVLGAVVNCAAGGPDSSGEPVPHEGSRRKGAVSGQPEVPAQQIET